MRRWGLMWVLLGGLGCHGLPVAAPVRPALPRLPTTTRGPTVPGVAEPAATPTTPTRPTTYRRLTADECRVLAIRNAALADELDSHPDNTPPGKHPTHKGEALADLSGLVRGYAADEIRNRAAGAALEQYYQLAAAEGQFDVATAAHAELLVQLAAAEKAAAGGLKGAEVAAIHRRVLETESRLANLEAGIVALNAGLAARLGLDPADPTPVWPADGLRVRGEDTDAGQAVATGLHYRPDLNLLRSLIRGEHPAGHLAEAVLVGVEPLLAGDDSASPFAAAVALLKKHPTRAEESARRQLAALLAARERQAEAEVRAAAATVRGERLAAGAKAAEVRNLVEQVAELEKKVTAGVAGAAADLAQAKLDMLRAKGELVRAAADWHVAEVKLRQATGMLVRE